MSTSKKIDMVESEKESNIGDGVSGTSTFCCAICLNTASTDPLATPCGHVFCSPCLLRWLSSYGSSCPVCKDLISINTLQSLADNHRIQGHDHHADAATTRSCFPCRACSKSAASQPVVLSPSGHVYCWPCLYALRDELPCFLVCHVMFSYVTPLYVDEEKPKESITGCGRSQPLSLSQDIPPRPRQRFCIRCFTVEEEVSKINLWQQAKETARQAEYELNFLDAFATAQYRSAPTTEFWQTMQQHLSLLEDQATELEEEILHHLRLIRKIWERNVLDHNGQTNPQRM